MDPIRVLFIHGLEGHPNGTKVKLLRAQYFDVYAADMHMSIWDFKKRNAVIRHLIRLDETRVAVGAGLLGLVLGPHAGRWGKVAGLGGLGLWSLGRHRALFAKALAQSFEACVQIQIEAVQQAQPDVVVGSSWGGAVAAELLIRGAWKGPTILLAPALEKVCTMTERRELSLKQEQLRKCASDSPILIFHDPSDEVIPHAHSLRLAEGSDIELRLVEAGGHRLLDLLERGELSQAIQHLYKVS